MSIVEKLKTIPNLYHFSGCSTAQIKYAQKELSLVFPDEFIDYVKAFGAISFYGTEWTGLNVEGYLNVVEATKDEQRYSKNFPKDCFVLENLGIEGVLTIVDHMGKVYSYQSSTKPVFICDSISDYLNICIQRKNG